MAAGDLITANYQYEYVGVLYGANQKLKVINLDGVFNSTEVKTQDLDRYDMPGSVPGPHMRAARKLTMTFGVDADSGVDCENILLSLNNSLRPKMTELPFVMLRPGRPKMFLNCRPTRYQVPTAYEIVHGLVESGNIEWTGSDPLWYSLVQSSQDIVVGAGNVGNSVVIDSPGTESTAPTFTITGPATNPRIQVSAQTPMDDGEEYNGLTVAVDVVLAAGDTLVIDTKKKIATKNGVKDYSLVRPDNQYWRLLPGNNTVDYTRDASNEAAASTCTVEWNDAWS
jgi:hypothetical protein